MKSDPFKKIRQAIVKAEERLIIGDSELPEGNHSFKGLRYYALHPGIDELPEDYGLYEIDKIRKSCMPRLNETIYVPTADGLVKMTFGEYLNLHKGGDKLDKWKFQLGAIVEDILTGYQGAVMARTQYLTGCDTYGVGMKSLDKDGKLPKWEWLEEQRLRLVKHAMPIEIEPIKDPGGPQEHPDCK